MGHMFDRAVKREPAPDAKKEEPREGKNKTLFQPEAVFGQETFTRNRRSGPAVAIQRKTKDEQGAGPTSPLVTDVLKSSSQPLDPETRSFMESRFKRDLGQVRLHTDDKAADSAKAINAKAYTVGQNVVFGSGEYQPQSQMGKTLLAHELAHTIQQSQISNNSVQTKELKVSQPGDAGEREADVVAEQVMNDKTPLGETETNLTTGTTSSSNLIFELIRLNLSNAVKQTSLHRDDSLLTPPTSTPRSTLTSAAMPGLISKPVLRTQTPTSIPVPDRTAISNSSQINQAPSLVTHASHETPKREKTETKLDKQQVDVEGALLGGLTDVLGEANAVFKGSGFVGAINQLVRASKHRPKLIGVATKDVIEGFGLASVAIDIAPAIQKILLSNIPDDQKANAIESVCVIGIVGLIVQRKGISVAIETALSGGEIGVEAGTVVPGPGNAIGGATGVVIGTAVGLFAASLWSYLQGILIDAALSKYGVK